MTCQGVIGRLAGLYVSDYNAEEILLNGIDAAGLSTYIVAVDNDPDFDDGTGSASIVGAAVAAEWVEITAIDVELDKSRDKIEASDRGTGEWKAFVPGQREGTLTFEAIKKKNLAWYDLVQAADEAGTTLNILMLDDKLAATGGTTILGAAGVIGVFNVFNFTETQALNEAIKISFELAPSGCSLQQPPVVPIEKL